MHPHQDTSFEDLDASHLLDSDDFKLDYESLLQDNDHSNPNPKTNSTIESLTASPCKKKKHHSPSLIPSHPSSASQKLSSFGPNTHINLNDTLNNPNLNLKPVLSKTNNVTNDLFRVTKHIRQNYQNSDGQFLGTSSPHSSDIFGLAETNFNDEYFSGRKLNNDKVAKLMNQLQEKDQEFEMDDQTRTRVFKGRFSKVNHNTDTAAPDHLDLQLNSYLSQPADSASNENKENLSPYPDPLKSIRNKSINSIRKSNKLFFKPPKKASSGITNKSQIPVLKPLTNLTNSDLRKSLTGDSFFVKQDNPASNTTTTTTTIRRSPKRVCTPKHAQTITPRKPSIKYYQQNHNIFIVDSSTGLINDATQFGTELNASNCEGFPLPEDVNEIVQIPTNEDAVSPTQSTSNDQSKKSKPRAKMAIIKALHNKYYSIKKKKRIPNQTNIKSLGFYSKAEFDRYIKDLQQQRTQRSRSSSPVITNENENSSNTKSVQVVSQSPMLSPSRATSKPTTSKSSSPPPVSEASARNDDETETDHETEEEPEEADDDDSEKHKGDNDKHKTDKKASCDSKKTGQTSGSCQANEQPKTNRRVRWAEDLEW